jgi:hypothetical protein
MQRIRLRPLGFQQPQAIAWTTFWRSLGPKGPMSWVKQDAILGGSAQTARGSEPEFFLSIDGISYSWDLRSPELLPSGKLT